MSSESEEVSGYIHIDTSTSSDSVFRFTAHSLHNMDRSRQKQATFTESLKVKVKGRALDIAPQVDTATTKALRYMARTKQRRTYLPYTFPAIAGTHLPTARGWRVE